MLGQGRDGHGQPASGADPLDRLPGPARSRAAEEQAIGSVSVGQPLELAGQPGPGLRSPVDLEPGREGHSGAAEPDAGVGAEAVGHFPASTEGGLALPVHLPALSPGGAQEGTSEVDDGQAVGRTPFSRRPMAARPTRALPAGRGRNADAAARSGRRRHYLKVLYEARLVEPRGAGQLDLVSGRPCAGQDPCAAPWPREDPRRGYSMGAEPGSGKAKGRR